MSEIDAQGTLTPPRQAEVEGTDLTGLEALGAAPGKPLSPAARRALEEAQARRAQAAASALAPEEGGPAGLEPTRFGDWERKGLAIDF